MGCILNVLCKTEDYGLDMINFTDEEAVRRCCESLKEDVQEYYSSEIDYMKDFDGEHIFGSTDPEKFKERIKNWNLSLCKTLSYYLKAIEDFAAKEGYEKLSDFVEKYVDENNIPKYMPYPASWYNLRKALCDYDNHFSYANDMLVFLDEEKGPRLSKETYEKVIAHPEEYAIMELCYD